MPSINSFKLVDSLYDSLGKIKIPLETSSVIPPVDVEMDIVNADIMELLCMDVLDVESLTP